MSDIKGKALEMANAFLGTDHATLALLSHQELYFALVHVVEQHESFRQGVSDIASVCAQHFCEKSWTVGDRQDHVDMLSRLIIPATKPDPLVDVFCKGLWSEAGLSISTKEIRAALEARGLEIREKGQGK